MGICNHTSWLSFHEEGGLLIQKTDRLTQVVASLGKSAQKWPCLVLLLGQSTMMRGILSKQRKSSRCSLQSAVHLKIDTKSTNSDRPVLYVYGGSTKQTEFDPEPTPELCHSTTSATLAWPDPTPTEVLTSLYSELISPFCGVICLFLSRKERLEDVVKRTQLLHIYMSSTAKQAARPQLLVVCDPSDTRSTKKIQVDLIKLFEQHSKIGHDSSFPNISVFLESSSQAALNNCIQQEVNISHDNRARHNVLLNSIHLEYFFGHAFSYFADHRQDPFDFVRASRSDRPVPAEMSSHLTELLTYSNSSDELRQYVIPLAAEYLMLDHYTYEVHCFHPEDVFEVHYKKACSEAAKNQVFTDRDEKEQPMMVLRTGLVQLVKQQFITRSWSHWDRRRQRTDLLEEFRPWLSKLSTHKFCLACLHSIPEHKFSCGHVFCEQCCTELGTQKETDPYLYNFDRCPLCLQSCKNMSVRTKPPTAGARVLSIDGGGIRAVIPIQFLRALELAIGLDNMPIQEHFDFAYGTSSGSMVILALFGLGMRVNEVHSLFRRLATQVFRGRSPVGFSFAATAHSLIASYRNGQFPAEDIDGPLSEIFGEATMLDHQYMSTTGTRIGFPIVDVDSNSAPSTCLVTSYNGAGQVNHSNLDSKATYRILRSSNIENEIRIKDGLRCASAAPWYFTPHTIAHHGTFMDGGISHNNPSRLALRELQRVLPRFKLPDQFVSIGTGSIKRQLASSRDRRSWMFGSGSVVDAFQHYMTHHFDGEQEFLDMLEMLHIAWPNDEHEINRRFGRFNIQLDGKLPDLADARAMESLSHAAWKYFNSDPSVIDLARNILASSFYFELRCMPKFEKGYYICYGRILCRISVANSAFKSLMQKLDKMSTTFRIGKNACRGRGKESFSFDQTGNFSKPVSFRVKSLDESVNVSISLSSVDCSISASPFTVSNLVSLQGLQFAGLGRDVQATTCTTADRSSYSYSPVAKRRCVRPGR